ncbi:sensor histidine kinase [Actinoplanes sp. NPDC020271]|uniref:sensor histidine kinase n=1 Tax=Actinoplanes sp. NPDC020271 TaxID=3363896 RepID=UPI00378AF480
MVVAVLAKWTRLIAGLVTGVVSAVAGMLVLVIAVPAGGLAARAAAALTGWERRRVAFALGEPMPPPIRIKTRRAYGYLAARLPLALLGAVVAGLLVVGIALAGIVVRAVVTGRMSVPDALAQALLGAALLTMNLQGVTAVTGMEQRLSRNLLEPSGSREALRARIRELATSRAEVVAAVDAERQRIERDLHDGLQQRLVALGVLLGRARRRPDDDRVAELLAQAHADVQQAVEEMREVAWRLYPSALTHNTLEDVLVMLAQRTSVPVKVDCSLPERPARPVETALYFVASEAITNAVKHARATVITVEIGASAEGVRMRVHDDGVGGADPDGTGLHGLARRVAALDGRLQVESPAGGGTTIRVEVPCD